MCILRGYNAWKAGYHLSLHYLHTLHHDQAISYYGQEGLHATVPLTHNNMKINILFYMGIIWIWDVSRDSP